MSRPIVALFTCLGIAGGLVARDAIESVGLPVGERAAVAIEAPAATFGIEVRAVLELPTATAKPTATISLTPLPTPTPGTDFYAPAAATPGRVYRWLPAPAPTATPYPSCAGIATPGALCEVRHDG